jgi:hypothetical protein
MFGKRDELSAKVGRAIALKSVLVRDPAKRRLFDVPFDMLTTNPDDVVGNPDVDIVVEVMGGERPALDYILRSISLGKHVVTANKEVMARHGRESFCCGAGGGAMWLDVQGKDRVENLRVKEAAETGARTLVTGCPFCKVMLESGQQSLEDDQRMQVKDLAELVAERLTPR